MTESMASFWTLGTLPHGNGPQGRLLTHSEVLFADFTTANSERRSLTSVSPLSLMPVISMPSNLGIASLRGRTRGVEPSKRQRLEPSRAAEASFASFPASPEISGAYGRNQQR